MVSARGGRHGFVYRSRHRAYRAIRRKGKTKSMAARIANAGKSRAGRVHGAQGRPDQATPGRVGATVR